MTPLNGGGAAAEEHGEKNVRCHLVKTGAVTHLNEYHKYSANEDESDYALFVICTIGWSLSWLYCYKSSNGNLHVWGNSEVISDAHSAPLVVLAALSLLGVVDETAPLSYSASFFVVDLFDTVLRGDLPFFVHAVISLLLMGGAALFPGHPMRRLKSLSKGFLTESSTPFLNRWKKSHAWRDYVIFFVVFTLCRIVWVPVFVCGMYEALGEKMDIMCWVSAAFYFLQLVWYVKMITILVNYKVPNEVKEAKEKRKIS